MKWIILLFLFFMLGAIIATRFSTQIRAAIEIWKSLEGKKQIQENKRVEKTVNSNEIPLVKCAKCGEWMAKDDAINLQNGSFYCSKNCFEKTAVAS